MARSSSLLCVVFLLSLGQVCVGITVKSRTALRARKVSACAAEKMRMARLLGDDDGDGGGKKFEAQGPFAGRGEACKECIRWSTAHKGAEVVISNEHLCTYCFSAQSACQEGKFVWQCYDQNEAFEMWKKHDTNLEPTDLEPVGFDDKEPKSCDA